MGVTSGSDRSTLTMLAVSTPSATRRPNRSLAHTAAEKRLHGHSVRTPLKNRCGRSAGIRERVQTRYGISFGNLALTAELADGEIDEELLKVVRKIEELAKR